MSQTLAAATTRRSPAREQVGRSSGRSTLRVVRPPSPEGGRTLFAACCLALLVGGLLVLLMVNTSLGQGSFKLHELQGATGELTDQQQALRQDVDLRASPERLAQRARALGMVPSGTPAFLRLADGKIFGAARPAKARPHRTAARSSGMSGKSDSGRRATSATSATSAPAKPRAEKKPTTGRGRT
jgi:hypothetical protein